MGKYERDWSDKEEVKVCEEMGGLLISKDYSTKGDILVGDTFFELKSTKKESLSFNTLANIGQNSLTDYGCFEGKKVSLEQTRTIADIILRSLESVQKIGQIVGTAIIK